MADPDPRSRSVSDWIPSVELGEVAEPRRDHRANQATAGSSEETRPKRTRARAAGLLIGVSVVAAVALGALALDGSGGSSGAEKTVLASEPEINAQPTSGVVGPSMALMLAVSIQARDHQANGDRQSGIEDDPDAPLGPITTRSIRARYVLTLGAVAVLLRRLGNKATRIAPGAISGPPIEAVRAELQRLREVTGTDEDSVYERARELDRLATDTIARVDEQVADGGGRELHDLAGKLSHLGREISRELEQAAIAAGRGNSVRAARLFGAVERRLENLKSAV
jgi:hypothetical protein